MHGRPAIALADYGLQSAVKMAVACAQVGVEHLCGIRLRVVPEASWHPWAEKPCELLLYAGDEEAWLSLIALHNRSEAHFARPPGAIAIMQAVLPRSVLRSASKSRRDSERSSRSPGAPVVTTPCASRSCSLSDRSSSRSTRGQTGGLVTE